MISPKLDFAMERVSSCARIALRSLTWANLQQWFRRHCVGIAIFSGIVAILSLLGVPSILESGIDLLFQRSYTEEDFQRDAALLLLPVPSLWSVGSLVVAFLSARSAYKQCHPRWKTARLWAVIALVCLLLTLTKIGMLGEYLAMMISYTPYVLEQAAC